MDEMKFIVKGKSVGKPLRRMCPRCHSHNTKFCDQINYGSSQPRYTCKHCRRSWTHGGACKTKRPSVSQVNSVENHFGSLPIVLALPVQSVPPMERMEVSDGSFHHGDYDVGSNANQEDAKKRNQSFNNTMEMNHNVSTGGSRGYPGVDDMINNNNDV